jgi:PAS domain S-box-containing protein
VGPGGLSDPNVQFQAVISQVKDYAIYTIDLDSKATSWNEGVERVLGYAEHEFLGHDITRLIFTPEAVRDGVPERELEQARVVGQANNDRTMRRKDHSTFFAAGITTSVRDSAGRHVGYVKVMRDQTQWKQLQLQLQQSLEELADHDRQRTEFLAVLAHELRNPLSPLRNAAEILSRVHGDPQRVASITEMMRRQIGQMGRLIDDLMDVSRITRGKIDLRRQPLDLSGVVAEAFDTVRPQCEQAGHHVTLGLSTQPLPVEGDPTRLAQVVANLVNNACKFTPTQGRIWVSTEREGDEAVLRVKDTGIGISLEDQARIFEMFTQSDGSMERARGGLGIGLALVRQLVELHGGNVQVHSPGVGHGSEFIARLPLAAVLAASAVAPAAGGPSEAKRILVVDDNVDAALSLAQFLEMEGHHVSVAHDGASALHQALEEEPDVVVLDIGLPGMNGFDVAARIREAQPSTRPLIVALTGWGQKEDRQRSEQAGIDAHMVKPIDPQSLCLLISTL